MKNILVIGASSGIGRQLALQLSADSRVYGTYKDKHTPNYDNVSFHFLDVTKSEIDLDFVPEVLHGFVYCPGSILLKPFSRMQISDFQKDFDINFLGIIKVLHKILPNLRKAEQASVVLFSSVAAKMGMPFHSSVAASKGAVEGFVKAIAAEFSPTIRVNCIAPSLTETPLAESLINTEAKIISMGNKHPLQRIGQPEDIANMVEMLLSKKAGWITGQTFHIDGGMSAIK